MDRQRHGEVPGQQFLQPVHGVIGDVLEHMPQIELRIKSVEFRGAEQAIDRSSAFAASIRSSKKIVLAAEGNGAQCPFSRRVVHLDLTVIDVARECTPA